VNETPSPPPRNRQSFANRQIRVLLMASSMEGGGSEHQTLLLLKHLDRTRFLPELYLLRRSGSLLAQLPVDVPVHCFEDQDRGGCHALEPDTQSAAVSGWFGLCWLSRIGWISRLCGLLGSLNWPGKIHRAQVRHVAQVLRQRQIDVIYDRTFHMTLIAGPAAKDLMIPRVSTIVSPPSRAVPLNAGRFLAAKRRRLRTAYTSAAAVVAVSTPTARDAARYYAMPRRRFTVIPNPVDARALDELIASKDRPPRDERWTIACVGRLSVEKGQIALLQALEALRQRYPDFPLACVWMIGDGPLRGELENVSRRMGLEKQVVFLGHIDQPAPWIAAADAVCLPSHFEGFPNVMLEAMAMGVPVIARSIDVTRTLGSVARHPEIRGRDYLALFSEHDGDIGVMRVAGDAAHSRKLSLADRPPKTGGIDLARKIRRVRLNTAATLSRVRSARQLARHEHSVAQLVPRIEHLLEKACVESWQKRPGS
jgi:glycosyltransferase involved in cell wall biosynthesis